jgi:hypothetical protein
MTVAIPSSLQITERRFNRDWLFYVIAAVLMLVFSAGGFRNFYLHGRAPWGEMTTQIMPLIVAHGLAMSGWVILFLVQKHSDTDWPPATSSGDWSTWRCAGRRYCDSRGNGCTLVCSLQPANLRRAGGAETFLAMMFVQLLSFGTLVGIGLVYCRRPEIHRPMMLLATIVIQSGSLGRFPYIQNLTEFPPLYVWEPVLLLGALLFVLQWGMNRAPNRWYLMGYAGMVAASLLSVAVGSTALWNRMARTFAP